MAVIRGGAPFDTERGLVDVDEFITECADMSAELQECLL